MVAPLQDLHLAKRFYDKSLEAQPDSTAPVQVALLSLALHSWYAHAAAHPLALAGRNALLPYHAPIMTTCPCASLNTCSWDHSSGICVASQLALTSAACVQVGVSEAARSSGAALAEQPDL